MMNISRVKPSSFDASPTAPQSTDALNSKSQYFNLSFYPSAMKNFVGKFLFFVPVFLLSLTFVNAQSVLNEPGDLTNLTTTGVRVVMTANFGGCGSCSLNTSQSGFYMDTNSTDVDNETAPFTTGINLLTGNKYGQDRSGLTPATTYFYRSAAYDDDASSLVSSGATNNFVTLADVSSGTTLEILTTGPNGASSTYIRGDDFTVRFTEATASNGGEITAVEFDLSNIGGSANTSAVEVSAGVWEVDVTVNSLSDTEVSGASIGVTAAVTGGATSTNASAATISIDNVAPTVSSINRKSGEDNPTNGSSVIFTVTFSEDLNSASVGTADFDIDIQSGSLSDVVLATAVTGVSTISADVYEVTVDVGSVADEEAVVGLDFDGADGTGGGVDDVAGNTTTGAQDYTPSDQSFTVDRVAPTFSFSPVDGSQVTTSPFTVTITFDEPLDDADELVIGDLAVTGDTGGSLDNFQEIAPNDNTTYTVDITPSGLGATDGGVDITLTLAASAVLDEAGNTNAVGSADYDYNTVPVVTTNAAADIGPTSADLGANVTSNGGRSVNDRGVYWTDDDSDPEVSGTRTLADDGQTGTGSATIQDVTVTSNANIDVKGFGTNDVGAGYGALEEFVTPPNPTTDAVVLTTVTSSTATLTGSIPEGGGLSLTSYGMAYNTSTAPTTANLYTNAGPGASTGGVAISQAVTSLTSNDVYFVRAYGLNSGTAEAYGSEVSFTTKAAVTTNAPSVINEDDATLDGTVAVGGGEAITTTGFVWSVTSTNSNPEIGGTGVTNVTVGSGSGGFSQNITGLSPGEQYTYKAYAINAGGTSYGSANTFRTDYSLAAGGASSAAEGGTVQFTVSLTAPAAASFTFNYSISGGTGNAVTGGDYTDQRGGSITWPMGSTTETFNVTAIDDAIAEGDETIVLNIEPGDDYTYSGSNPYRSTTIVDNDNTLTITSTAPDLDEGDAGTFTLEFEDATSVERDFTIGYTIDANDTEGAGSDYSAFSGTATIASSGSVTTTDVGFTALDDDFAEIDESFTLNVSSGTALGTNYIGTPSQTATIHDVDFVVTMGTQPNALVEGSGETRDFIIQLEGAPTVTAEQDLVASYNVTYTNVTTADTDIGAGGNIWATISAGQSSTTVTYGEKQDVFAEGDETFYITLTTQRISSFPNEPYTIGTTGTQTATIQDDTDNTVTITSTDVTEGTTATMFNVAFPTGITAQRDFTFTYATTYDLADATDHSDITGSVQITSGENNTSFGTSDHDDWAEGDEDVTLTINDGSAVTPKYKRNSVPEDATSTIIDVDNTISIVGTDRTEGDTDEMFVVSFPTNVGAQRAFTVDYVVSYPGSLGSAADHDTDL
ncbi:MAG: Calx-beta domain-containing protein, partial [Cyclobacteriaceae bacterium]